MQTSLSIAVHHDAGALDTAQRVAGCVLQGIERVETGVQARLAHDRRRPDA